MLWLQVALPKRVFALQRRHRMRRVSTPDRILSRLRKAEIMYLAGSHQLPHRSRNVLNRNLRINAVLVEQVNIFNLQASQRSVDDLADMFRAAVGPAHLATLDAKPKLCSDDGLFPPALECPSHQLFIDEGAVDFRRVKEIESQLERTVNGGN